jgi:hypothetical protein
MRARDFLKEAASTYDDDGTNVTIDGPLKIRRNNGGKGDASWWINGEVVGAFIVSTQTPPGYYVWYSMPDSIDKEEQYLSKKIGTNKNKVTFHKPTKVSKEVFDQLLAAELSDLQ